MSKESEALENSYYEIAELLQEELEKHFREVPYTILNDIKKNVLKQYKEWIEND